MFTRNLFQVSRLLKSRRFYIQNAAPSLSENGSNSKEITLQKRSDESLNSMRSATSQSELFDLIKHSEKSLSPEHLVEAFRVLFNLQKTQNAKQPADGRLTDIKDNSEFEELCKHLRRNSRALRVNDLIEILKILIYLEVPAQSNIVHVILNILRYQINDVTLSHVIFLDFLLKKTEKTPLVEAIQIALPMLFQIQLKSQIDHENVPQLIDLLGFVTKNEVSNQSITNILSALTLHGDNLKVQEAAAVMNRLTELRIISPGIFYKLLENCFKVLNRDYRNMPFATIERILSKLTKKIVFRNDYFYDEKFFNNSASFVIENDVGLIAAFYILKKFNKINFVNIDLLDYVAEILIKDSKDVMNSSAIYLFYIGALSIANYKPKSWEKLQHILLQHPILNCEKKELPLIKLCLELMSLGCYDYAMVDKLFHDEFLEKFLSRDKNTLDYVQLLLLYQTVVLRKDYTGCLPNPRFLERAIEVNSSWQNKQLKACLEYIFDGEKYVQTTVRTRYGHLIDHVIIFNEKNEPVPLENAFEDVPSIEDLRGIGNSKTKLACILTMPPSCYAYNVPRLKAIFQMKVETLQNLELAVIPINFSEWNNLGEKEKLPYLEREIKFNIEKFNI